MGLSRGVCIHWEDIEERSGRRSRSWEILEVSRADQPALARWDKRAGACLEQEAVDIVTIVTKVACSGLEEIEVEWPDHRGRRQVCEEESVLTKQSLPYSEQH